MSTSINWKLFLPGNEQPDAERHNETERVSDDLVVGDFDVGLVEDHLAKSEDPEWHHEKCRECRNGGHCDRQV